MHLTDKDFRNAPVTAKDLDAYEMHVLASQSPSPSEAENNGKVNPSKYGSIKEYDLGLCYKTFYTGEACRHGTKCPWRHAPLRDDERAWMAELGAKAAIDLMDLACTMPCRPEASLWDRRRRCAA
jgi:hypothetical protein